MRPQSPSLLVPLLLLVLVIGLLLHQSPEPVADAAGEVTQIQATKRGRIAAPESDEAKALRISPPAWTPPAVFAQTGKPAARIAFTRGENAERRYATPETKEPDPGLRAHAPGVLAMTPADGRLHLLPEEIDLHTRLARRMVFNPAALDNVIAGNASRLLAPTVNNEVLTLQIGSVKSRSVHSHTLQGHVVGEESTSDVQLVYHDGVIQGNIVLYASGREIEYRILADGHMMVREIDQSTMTAECGKPPETVADAVIDDLSEQGLHVVPQDDGEISGDTVGWRSIDVVVGYDAGARVAQGGYSQIEALIIASVDRMTTAFSNSLITSTELILLGTIEDPAYVYPGSSSDNMSEELGNLNNFSNGILDTVSSYATRLGADFVSFVLKDADGSAGIAYRPGRASITARTYMTSTRITFAHELGHNLGCNHSWGDSSQTYESHYGWRLDVDGNSATTTDRVRTIMAYDWGWGQGHRIPYFANPNVSYNGAPTGVATGHNVQSSTKGDQRYYQNGLSYTNGTYGFNGANPALGATNANTIHTGGAGPSSYGATYASSRATRTAFQVISPGAGVQWERGSTRVVSFNGGDMDDTATIKLYKGGVLNSTLASGLDPATDRDYSWTLPLGLASGSDYMIRVELVRNGSTLTADSGIFGIFGISNLTPQVIAQSPAVSMPVNGVVSQLVITFNNAMNPATFSVVDDVVSFTGPGAANLKPAISGAAWSSGNTVLALNFTTQSTEGSYILVLGSQIQDSNNEFLDQDMDGVTGETVQDRYTAGFSILNLGGALDTSGLAWATTGNVGWFPQSAITHDGVDAAQSGNIGDSQASSLESTLTGPGALTFWWKVSSESGYDYLRFYLNGVEQAGAAAISGDVDWVQKTVSLPAGSQTIKWIYSKDGSDDGGTDTAWVDQVVFTPSSAPEIAVQQPAGTDLTDGGAAISFGPVNTGGSSPPFTFTIRNTGTADLTGLAVSKSGTHGADYALGSLGSASLAPGASTTFTVTFSPGASGTRSAALQIASNDANENPFDIALTGTGVNLPPPAVPEIVVELPAGTGLTDGSGSIAFGGVNTGASAALTFTIKNTGTADLSGLTVTRNGTHEADFALGGLGASTLAAGASTTFEITFSPGAVGARTATISIASNDANENPFDIALTGTGINLPPPAVPEIVVELPAGTGLTDGSGSIAFGGVNTGASAALTFTIKNTGTADLSGLTVTRNGTHEADFALGGLGASTLAAGASTTFEVTFSPGAVGARTAAISIASNDANENPFDIALTGTGKPSPAPEIAVRQGKGPRKNLKDGKSMRNLGTVTVGKSGKAMTFRVKNLGERNLENLKVLVRGRHGKDFKVVKKPSRKSLKPGAFMTFKIMFKPLDTGFRKADLRIKSNDANENPFNVKLSGKGRPPGSGVADDPVE